MDTLSDPGRSAYLRYVKERIIERCKSMGLPLFVQSTAVVFWTRHPQHSISAAISLACKANDQDTGPEPSDLALAEALGYDFHEPSPYLRMYGFLIILQERALIAGDACENRDAAPVRVDISRLWAQGVATMEKILVLEGVYAVNEMAAAALDLPPALLGSAMDVDPAAIEEIRRRARALGPIDPCALAEALEATDIGEVVR